MKFLVQSYVEDRTYAGNRTAQNRQIFKKTTIALCLAPNDTGSKSIKDMCFMLIIDHKTAQRYYVKSIEKILDRFLSEGKTTIIMKTPLHNIQLKGDKLQLTSLIKKFKMAMAGGSASDIGGFTSSLSTKAIPATHHPVTRLNIKSRHDYAAASIPNTIRHLKILPIDVRKINSAVLRLKNISSLDFSNNLLETIPEALGDLPLEHINFNDNKLSETDWRWITKPNIVNCCKDLLLRGNGLKALPNDIFRVENLRVLDVSDNLLKCIPWAYRRAANLRSFDCHNNNLLGFPLFRPHQRFSLLDLSGNPLKFNESTEVFGFKHVRGTRQPKTLLQLAGQRLRKGSLNLRKAPIPKSLLNQMLELPQCWMCDALCYLPHAVLRTGMELHRIKCEKLVLPMYGEGGYVFCCREH